MPAVYQELPADTFDYATDWLEAIDNTGPGNTVDATGTTQEATLTGYVPFNKYRSAMRYFLGYSYADTAAPWALHREPPQAHPEFPQLYAYAMSATPFAPEVNPDGTFVTKTQSLFDPDQYFGSYQQRLVTIRFKSFGRMRFFADSSVGEGYVQEYLRWTMLRGEPAIETLNVDGYQLTFSETTGPPNGPVIYTGPGTKATPFPCPIPELFPKCTFALKWFAVPHEYLSSDPEIFRPTKILSMLGYVNSADFLGAKFKTHTMLLTSVTFDETLYPVTPANPLIPVTGYDVTFMLLENPKESAVAMSSFRGHRVYPWRANGKWYHAVRPPSGNEFLPGALPGADLNKLFQHVDDPT